MTTTPEGEVKKIIKNLLAKYDIRSAKDAGKFKSAAGWYFCPVPWGVRGIPDFVGVHHEIFWSVEAKKPGAKPTGFQALQEQAIRAGTGVVFIVDGEESLKIFENWLKEPK